LQLTLIKQGCQYETNYDLNGVSGCVYRTGWMLRYLRQWL
jgi:hypothetical protein